MYTCVSEEVGTDKRIIEKGEKGVCRGHLCVKVRVSEKMERVKNRVRFTVKVVRRLV